MTILQNRFQRVYGRIHQAEQACNRNGQVQLLAVSKTKPASMVREAWHLGQKHFGENYLQEALDKMDELNDLSDIQWHFIGPIQSNKTRDISTHFDWVHSVDRLKIAQRLNDQRPQALPPLNICLQVNISGEETKSGISLNELPVLVQSITHLPNLKLRGLMAIPAPETEPDRQREPFRALTHALHTLNDQFSLTMDTLSMGMTDDLESAIQEGSTMVRIGTALFGSRHSVQASTEASTGTQNG
ncbi:YggS family pyridoxal phosphate-dependent enzyme [Endozoicomonas sp. SCSIO W0465]|uniref:YggS family pyridoxal phosphate-dependent enzyme n=1 Tax=Endozoicomonas sp. SCSIO W0465 TaxID=2918516 RepID=UPI002076513F|nr:YggS family pyridoxal phosphate-dependent enzyme [Endozoicomonas sp. SCSIO W0465]USE36513.1 YggS family pyridoxal phosphate-dependent enzyme [Endozoicomonas sp. SCSIO W0465]